MRGSKGDERETREREGRREEGENVVILVGCEDTWMVEGREGRECPCWYVQ